MNVYLFFLLPIIFATEISLHKVQKVFKAIVVYFSYQFSIPSYELLTENILLMFGRIFGLKPLSHVYILFICT